MRWLACLLVMLPFIAHAGNITLYNQQSEPDDISFEWDANHINDNVVSYTIYWSETSGTYTSEDSESVTDIETRTSRRDGNHQWTASDETGVFYCEANGGGDPNIAEPDRVYNADEIMTSAGFSAGETEHLSETDFATHANWDVTGDLDDSGGNAEYTFSSNQTSTLTQNSGDFAAALIGGTDYRLIYTVAVTTAPDGDLAMTLTTALVDEAVALAFTAGTHSYDFTTKASPGNFVIQIVSGDDTEGQFSIDDISIVKYAALSEEYWAHGDVDGLGYDTIYVRVTDDADPDTLDTDAIESSIMDDPVEYDLQEVLVEDTTYYFVVTATNDSGYESDESNEVNSTIESVPIANNVEASGTAPGVSVVAE